MNPKTRVFPACAYIFTVFALAVAPASYMYARLSGVNGVIFKSIIPDSFEWLDIPVITSYVFFPLVNIIIWRDKKLSRVEWLLTILFSSIVSYVGGSLTVEWFKSRHKHDDIVSLQYGFIVLWSILWLFITAVIGLIIALFKKR